MSSDTYDTYVAAIRRDQRHLAPDDWLEQIAAIEGASVIGGFDRRAQIRATPDAVKRIQSDMGDFLLIEPVIEHRPIQAKG